MTPETRIQETIQHSDILTPAPDSGELTDAALDPVVAGGDGLPGGIDDGIGAVQKVREAA